MDAAGLVLWDEKEDRRFSQPELVLDSLFSVVLLLTAVRGRNTDRRELEVELSLEDGTWLVDSSLPNMKSLGADHWRWGCDGWTGRPVGPVGMTGVVGCDTLRRDIEGAAEGIGQLVLEAPGHFRLPGRSICDSNWSVPKARPAAAAPTVPKAQSWISCQYGPCFVL